MTVVDRAVQGALAVLTEPAEPFDAIAVYAAAVEAGLEAALWVRPSEDFALVGIGRAWVVEADGPDRFAVADAEWRALAPTIDDPDASDTELPRGVGPVLLGGLGFRGRVPAHDDAWAPFGASSLVLPQWIGAQTAGGTWITTSTGEAREPAARRRFERILARARELAPARGGLVARPVIAPLAVVDERPDETLWRWTVGLFAGAVGRGRIDKVVLARRVIMTSPADLDVENGLRRLAAGAPESTCFAFRRDGRTFMGATPERLIRTDGRSFRTVAIAGSIGRGANATEDAALGRELVASDKDREEHSVVVDAIRDRLMPICDELRIEPEPHVLTLRTVQHLVTEIEGVVHERAGLLALAERLHPTPAVGGEPRDIALGLIDEHEGFDRGWYAGPIGWLGADGDGELMVALRSGIVDHTRVTLFAGCGIVADSDPEREWEESRLKLRTLASALGRPGDEP
jgi:menaquinone-specific isochorismate synthase